MMNEQNVYLSLVIPVYNEERRITAGLTHTLDYLKTQRFPWEIVLVDDGSADRTIMLAQKLLDHLPHQLIRHGVNRGKGAAVKSGMLAARGQYVVFSDIDFSTPISELPKLLAGLKNHDLAIGTRRHPQSQVVKRQPKLREFLGHVFTKLTNVFLTPGIYDATCGFKGYRGEVARDLYTQTRVGGWAFDAEVLFIARRHGYSIVQIPVTWADNSATKVHLLHDGLMAFRDLVRIRWWDLFGYYHKPGSP